MEAVPSEKRPNLTTPKVESLLIEVQSCLQSRLLLTEFVSCLQRKWIWDTFDIILVNCTYRLFAK